jgi:hypothetical protein
VTETGSEETVAFFEHWVILFVSVLWEELRQLISVILRHGWEGSG